MPYLCAMINEQQEKWLRQTEVLFLRYGTKSLNMDDIARELGISKKTLYQFVENKDDLVRKVLERYISSEKNMCTTEFLKAENAIEEMKIVIEMNSVQLSHMKANLVFDLQRYHRDTWNMMMEFKQGFLYKVVRANLERGINEGVYRSDLNVDIVTKLHISASFQLFDEDLFPSAEYSRAVIFKEYLRHYLYGIMSEKGIAIFNQLSNK